MIEKSDSSPNSPNDGLESPPSGQPSEPAPRAAYQPPTLTYVGNVHALLAGTGLSPTSDGNKGSLSRQ